MTQKDKDIVPDFFVGQISHAGYERLLNEDQCGQFSTRAGEILVVAGGGQAQGESENPEAMVGEGQAGGGVASRLAVATIHSYIKSADDSESPPELLTQAILAADVAVAKAGAKYDELRGVGSTLAVLLLRDKEAWFVQLGGGGLYLLTEGVLHNLDLGLTNPADIEPEILAETRPELSEKPTLGNIILSTNILGQGLDSSSITVGHHQCREDDLFLLSTETLVRLVEPQTMESILKMQIPTLVKARKLIEEAENKGGGDNVSAQVLSFRDYPDDMSPAGGFKLASGWWPGLVAGLILGGGALTLWHFFGAGKF